MYNSATNRYGLSDSGEYLINVEDIEETPEEIKAYIPKLMPKVQLGDKAEDNIRILVNPNIFTNAPDCAITGVSQLTIGQNYITVKPYKNQRPNFRSKAKKKGDKYIVEKHNKFVLELLHNDIGNMYFTGKV